jgi:MFS family permease
VYATSATGIAYAAHIVIPDLYTLGFLRAGLGFARGGILHSLFSVMSLHTPAERRGGVMGIASSMAILGNSIGPILGGFVASKFGLLSVFGFNSALFLFIALMIWRSDIEPPKPVPAAEESSKPATPPAEAE